MPDLEVQDLFTRLQPHLPSLLLEPEVEFIRGSKENGTASEWRPTAQLSALRLVRELAKTMTSKQVGQKKKLQGMFVLATQLPMRVLASVNSVCCLSMRTLTPPPAPLPHAQLGAVLGEDDAHSLVGLATPSTYRGCREVAYATLLDLHVAAREAPAPVDSSSTSTAAAKENPPRGGAAMTHAQRETVRCALLRGLSDPDDEGKCRRSIQPIEVKCTGLTLRDQFCVPGYPTRGIASMRIRRNNYDLVRYKNGT